MLKYFVLSILIIIIGVSYALKLKNDLKSFSAALTLTVSFAISALVFPCYLLDGTDLLISTLGALRYGIIAVGMNVSTAIMEYLPEEEPLATMYKCLLYALYIAGPVCASMFIISFSRSVLDSLRMFGHKNVHVFSQINDRSLAIAESIYENDRKQTLIFCNSEDAEEQLKTKAYSLHALVLEGNEHLHISSRRNYEFYEIDDDHQDCLIAVTSLCDYLLKQKHYSRERVVVRYFVSRDSLELIRNLDAHYGKDVYLRYIDEDNMSAISLLRECKDILAPALHNEIHIYGSNDLALSILRNLLCLLVQPGTGYAIHVFAADVKKLAKKLKNESPEILNCDFDRYFARERIQGSNCNVRFHEFDNYAPEFETEIKQLRLPDVVFVCKDDDEDSYRTSMQLKRLFSSFSPDLTSPLIYCSLKDSDLNKIIDEDNSIRYFGNYAKRYDYQSFIMPELEKAAKRTHLAYLSDKDHDVFQLSDEEKEQLLEDTGYYSYVNQNSSYCAALAMEYRLAYILSKKDRNIADEDFVREWILDDVNMMRLAEAEHERWNTYQRLQGWRCADTEQMNKIALKSQGKNVKDNDLLLHPAIVPYDILDEVEHKADDIYSRLGSDRKSDYIEADKKLLRQILKILDKE